MRREAMKAKMILKKGMVFLFAMVMVLTGIFSLGVMAASGLEGAYISPKSKMGLQYANNFSRDVSKSQVSVPNFMADSDTNGEEPNKSFTHNRWQQVIPMLVRNGVVLPPTQKIMTHLIFG